MMSLNQRVHDLVRFMRSELHREGLITDEEYAGLASDSYGVVKRLEDYDVVMLNQEAKNAAALKRPSGLVSVLISEIAQLNKSLNDWKHEFHMYRDAWIRELGGKLIHKSHDIDALVLTTRYFMAKVSPAEKPLRSFPVTDDLLDAPDGSEVFIKYRRVGDRWEQVEVQDSHELASGSNCKKLCAQTLKATGHRER